MIDNYYAQFANYEAKVQSWMTCISSFQNLPQSNGSQDGMVLPWGSVEQNWESRK